VLHVTRLCHEAVDNAVEGHVVRLGTHARGVFIRSTCFGASGNSWMVTVPSLISGWCFRVFDIGHGALFSSVQLQPANCQEASA
jgi:hypothetical protein